MDKKKMLEAIIAHETNGNKAQFAKILGVSPQTISAWIARSTFDAENIYTKCRYINPSWLLTGEGEMLKTKRTTSDLPPEGQPDSIDKGTKKDTNHQENQQLSSDRPLAIPSSSPEEGIPLIPIEAMAGALTSEQTVLEYECERYVVPVFKGADFLIPVKGSSMYPKYSSGDIVACQRVPMSGLFFQWNKVYVIDTDQGPLIKRIKPGSTTDRILIISDNQDYDPFELPVSSIHAVSLVIGVIRLE